MSTFEQSVDVQSPITVVYAGWMAFERYPSFMEAVEHIRRGEDGVLQWRIRVDGVVREWDAEVTELRPNELIAWRSTCGIEHSGTVTFQSLAEGGTRVTFRQEVDPSAVVGEPDSHRRLDRQIRRDLRRFAELSHSPTPATVDPTGQAASPGLETHHGDGLPRAVAAHPSGQRAARAPRLRDPGQGSRDACAPSA